MPRPLFGATDGTWNPSGRRHLVPNEELAHARPRMTTINASFLDGGQRMILDAPLEDILAACGRDDTAVIGERRLRGGVSALHPRLKRGGCKDAHAVAA